MSRDLVDLHRLRFPVPIICLCAALWGASFAAGSIRDLFAPPVLMAIVANVLLVVAPLALNSAVDVATDRRDHGKRGLVSAVERLGGVHAIRWPAVEMLCATLLAIVVSVWTSRWLIIGIAFLIIAAQILYNLEPARLKRRGVLGTIVFGLATALLPCLLSYQAVRADVGVSAWLVFSGLTAMTIGRNALWSVPDRAADLATGMRTSAVRYGVPVTVLWTSILMLVGNLLLGFGLWSRYGLVASLAGSSAYLAFLGIAVIPYCLSRRPLDSVQLAERALPLVAVGDTLLVVIPLCSR